ncbi:MAG TPA: ABC transporter substrate-binding protein [Coleofasciculaceae cyanobacterium]
MFRASVRRNIHLGIALMSAVIILCSSCVGQFSTSSTKSKPLVVGTIPWIGYSGQYVAQDQGFFKNAGLKVEDLFLPDTSALISNFLEKKMDIGWVTTGDFIQIVGQDPDVRVIKLADYSNGADAIIARGVTKPEALRGKAIARENVMFVNNFLSACLEKGGLTLEDVKLVDMVMPDSAAAYVAGKVEAAYVYEPTLTNTLKTGGGQVVCSTKGTNLIGDVVLVRKQLIEERKQDLLTYLRAIDKAVKLVNAEDKPAIKSVSEHLKVTPEEVKAQLDGVTLFDIQGDKTIGFNSYNLNNLPKHLRRLVKFAVEDKVLTKSVNVDDLYDDSLVESL